MKQLEKPRIEPPTRRPWSVVVLVVVVWLMIVALAITVGMGDA